MSNPRPVDQRDATQIDLFSVGKRGGSPLEHELWHRREQRREGLITADMSPADALLAPLALALARMAAQRDARTRWQGVPATSNPQESK